MGLERVTGLAPGLRTGRQAATSAATGTLTEEHTRAVIAVVVAALVCGCVVPAPGMMKWEICFSYGPEGKIVERRPDGTVIERHEQDSDEAVKQTMRACRD